MLITLLLILGATAHSCSAVSKELSKKFYSFQEQQHDMKGVATVQKIQFLDFKESVFSDFGDGIAVEDWDSFVESLASLYSIPKEGENFLKDFKKLEKRATHTQNLELKKKSGAGNFGFLRVGVEKTKEGKLDFLMAGTQISFEIALLDDKSVLDSIFSYVTGIDGSRELVLTTTAKEDLQSYFLTNALNSARKFDITFQNDEL